MQYGIASHHIITPVRSYPLLLRYQLSETRIDIDILGQSNAIEYAVSLS